MVAIELIQAELKKLYQAIEMERTHADNMLAKSKEHEANIVGLECKKLALIAALEKLK